MTTQEKKVRKEATNAEPSPVPLKRTKMAAGELLAAALDNISTAMNRGYDLREREQEDKEQGQKRSRDNREREREEDRETQETLSQTLQERAMLIIEQSFPNSTQEEQDFQFQAMTVIEDDG